MNINPGNPIAVSTNGEYESCELHFNGNIIANPSVSEGAAGSTIAIIDGGVTAKHGPGVYVFKFFRNGELKASVSQSVHPWDHDDVDAAELPELVGTHGWLIVHNSAPDLPEITISSSTNTVSIRMAGLVIASVTLVQSIESLIKHLTGF